MILYCRKKFTLCNVVICNVCVICKIIIENLLCLLEPNLADVHFRASNSVPLRSARQH